MKNAIYLRCSIVYGFMHINVSRDGASLIIKNGDCVSIARNSKEDFFKMLNG